MGISLLHCGLAFIGAGLVALSCDAVISCPCALGLATRVAVWWEQEKRADQMLIKSGEAS